MKEKTKMNNKKRDVKFIIYQALYILVICIVAIKGANIDLTEVDEKRMIEPGWTYVDTTNKVLIDKTELSRMIVFDSTKFVLVSIEDYRKNPVVPPIQVAGLSGIQTPPNDNTTKNPNTPVTTPDYTTTLPPMVLGGMQLIQYHDNIIQNKNGYPITVKGITIPANSTKTVRIDGDAAVVISSSQSSTTVSTSQNKRPEISFQKLTDMGANASAKQLQRITGYRVKIQDDYPEQLEVKITGPVSVKKVDNTTYDVTLNAFSNESAFNSFAENRTAPYQVGFSVIAADKIAPHNLNRQQAFVFGEW
jgi:hypothetical protein